MDIGSIVVIVLRLVVPFAILRYPLAGIAACMTLDTFDVVLVDILGGHQGFGGGVIGYHALDKILDTYYLVFILMVALRWENTLARNTSIILFAYRFIGVVLFELTGQRALLLVFPNFFEYFVVFNLITQRFFPRFGLVQTSQLAMVFLIIGVPQLLREFTYHYLKMSLVEQLNTFTPLNIRESTLWEWVKATSLQILR